MNETDIRESATSLVDYGKLAASMRKCLTLAQTRDSSKLTIDGYVEYGDDIVVSHQDYQPNSPLVARYYVGSVFGLLPSGKFYMPYACSNLKPCPACGGSGQTSKLYDCEYCAATGKRYVSEIASIRDEPYSETRQFLARDHEILSDNPPEQQRGEYIVCPVCHGSGKRPHDCEHCGGLGSREAWEDETWYNAIHEIANQYGLWLEAGEGAPCDLFLCMAKGDD